MWQVQARATLQQFWQSTDAFVLEFLSYALDLQHQNLPVAALAVAATTPPGQLGLVATTTVQDYLVQLAACAELPSILRGYKRAVKSYRDYLTYPSRPLLVVSEANHNLLHEIFKYFYDDLIKTKCFRESYLGLKGKGSTGRAYRTLFGRMHRTCPYCDQELIAKVSNSQIDHFFAKSQHPLFAVHWTNLVVSCVSCNAGVKLTTPIGHHEGVIKNLPIFHPFFDQPADHIRCRFNKKVTKVWIRSNGSPGSLNATKVLHWARVFGLETQYEAELPTLRDLAKTLRERAKLTYRLVKTQGGVPDLECIYDEILDFEERKVLEQCGSEPGMKLKLDFFYFLRKRKGEDLDYLRPQL